MHAQLPEPLARVVSDFSAWEAKRGDKPRTIEAYLRNAREFLLCGPNPVSSVKDVSQERVERYERSCSKSRSQATVYAKLSSIKIFLRFLWEAGHLDSDLSNQFALPSPEKRWPAYLSHAQEASLIRLLEGYESPQELEIRAIVELLLHSPKMSEFVAMNISDIDSDGRFSVGSSPVGSRGFSPLLDHRQAPCLVR
jgi:site-specific recombinase XerD